jgi:hypothetical protein
LEIAVVKAWTLALLGLLVAPLACVSKSSLADDGARRGIPLIEVTTSVELPKGSSLAEGSFAAGQFAVYRVSPSVSLLEIADARTSRTFVLQLAVRSAGSDAAAKSDGPTYEPIPLVIGDDGSGAWLLFVDGEYQGVLTRDQNGDWSFFERPDQIPG